MKRQKNKKVVVDATTVWKALKPHIMVLCADTTITEKRDMTKTQKNVSR